MILHPDTDILQIRNTKILMIYSLYVIMALTQPCLYPETACRCPMAAIL